MHPAHADETLTPLRPLAMRVVYRALKAQLAGPAAFLDTDHVELRRCLVDMGWLQRDGFGRARQRVPLKNLPAGLQPLARPLTGLDTAAWTRGRRVALAQARAARRVAWEGRPPEAGT